MSVLNIAVIEDELIIARTIASTLNEIGYAHCGPAINYTEAIHLLETKNPDLLLLDINLSGKKDGIDVARLVNEKYKLPFIFLTANSDAATIERAKMVNPHAYIVKPFTKEDLFTAIEIAFNNFNRYTGAAPMPQTQPPVSRNYLFVKDGYRFRKVLFDEIVYMQSDHNYVTVYLSDNQKMLVRSQLNEFVETLPHHIFKQVHRSYLVNIDKIKSVEPTEVIVQNAKVPVSPAFKTELMKTLGIE